MATMTPAEPLDSVIVGYNELDYRKTADQLQRMEDYSGAYRNSSLELAYFRGQPMQYMEIFNTLLAEQHGGRRAFNVYEQPNLGVSYLKSFLSRRGFRVEAVNFFNSEKSRLIELLAQRPRTIAI